MSDTDSTHNHDSSFDFKSKRDWLKRCEEAVVNARECDDPIAKRIEAMRVYISLMLDDIKKLDKDDELVGPMKEHFLVVLKSFEELAQAAADQTKVSSS